MFGLNQLNSERNNLVGKNMHINFHKFYLSHYNTRCICVIIMKHPAAQQVHTNWPASVVATKFKFPTYFEPLLSRVSIDISIDTRRKTKIGFCA